MFFFTFTRTCLFETHTHIHTQELDYPSEFHIDRKNAMLYVYHNGTGAPPSDGWIVPDKFVLVNLTGTQWNPVKDVHLSNVKYTASGATCKLFLSFFYLISL